MRKNVQYFSDSYHVKDTSNYNRILNSFEEIQLKLVKYAETHNFKVHEKSREDVIRQK